MKGELLKIVEQPPIACSLEGDARGERLQQWHDLGRSVKRRERIPGGLSLIFESKAEDDVRRLAGLEKQCCDFFNFEFESGPDAFVLRVTAPADAERVVTALFDPSEER